MRTYARRTRVPVDQSRLAIERLVVGHGATRFYSAQEEGRALIGFELADRRIQFAIQFPPKSGRGRDPEQVKKEMFRALLLSVKAKFVAIEAGVETLEQAFLAHVVMPNGQTVHEHLKGYLAEGYKVGKMPPMLPALGGA